MFQRSSHETYILQFHDEHRYCGRCFGYFCGKTCKYDLYYTALQGWTAGFIFALLGNISIGFIHRDVSSLFWFKGFDLLHNSRDKNLQVDEC